MEKATYTRDRAARDLHDDGFIERLREVRAIGPSSTTYVDAASDPRTGSGKP
jgi:hypothetical protein